MPELTALLCKGCGAPLPESDDLQRQVTCRFCGVVNERAQAGVPLTHVEVRVHGPQAGATAGGKVIAAVVVAFVLVMVGSAAWVIDSAVSTVRTTSTTVTTAAKGASSLAARAETAAKATVPLPRTELFGLDGRGGWRTLAVDQPPPGGWARVDPAAALAWARDLVRPWAPDAALYRVDVEKMGDDGLIDLTSEDAELGFRFVSPGRIAAWKKEADLKANIEAVHGLTMTVKARETRVLAQRGRPDPSDVPPDAAASMPMGDLLARARRSKAWTPKPFYQGYLIRLKNEGWVWYLGSLSGRDSLPRVRAKDGRAYPYR